VARWLQLVAVLAIAGLLANAQCLARCLASMRSDVVNRNDSPCHHSSQSQESGGSHCASQHHLETLAKTSPTALLPAIADTAVASPTAAITVPSWQPDLLSDRGLPPDKPLFLTISVLRL
jgi:hypothetical protein